MKKIITIVAIFFINSTFAASSNTEKDNTTNEVAQSVIEIIDPPGAAALTIIVDSLSSLKELKKHNQSTIENIKALINVKLFPHLDINTALKISLKGYWEDLDFKQRQVFYKYIVQSLVNDYAAILVTYDNLDSINVSVDPEIVRKDNRALVKLRITFNDDPKVTIVSLKMIRSNRWKVYDVVFSGVSLVKNYRSQFKSYIRRNGLEALVEKISNKLDNV
ncbi:MAG: ABC transporter substrate-binding protein [Gammaproteobacteria bacterium]|nr:ABC transporter substrate-binding protein [Gammaproteobacteria bacterium]|tara:strand:- start:10247 stop:10906 length:660 start_codon:yes stop_codon:yes gene_type:complete